MQIIINFFIILPLDNFIKKFIFYIIIMSLREIVKNGYLLFAFARTFRMI